MIIFKIFVQDKVNFNRKLLCFEIVLKEKLIEKYIKIDANKFAFVISCLYLIYFVIIYFIYCFFCFL